jgi:hypothetical protein
MEDERLARLWARRARALDPGLPDAHAAEASAERASGELDRAERALRRAISLSPSTSEFLGNAGNLRLDREVFEEARRYFRRALAVAPRSGNPRFQLACLDLCDGRLVEGWAEYEARFIPAALAQRRPFPQPEWRGETLTSGSLLVWGEQGVGDEIVFSTLLGEATDRAAHVILECDARLAPIFARSFPRLRVQPRQHPPHPALLSPTITHQLPLGSLPRLFRPSVASFSGRQSSLRPDPRRCEASRYWLAGLGDGLKVGIAWRSIRRNFATRRIHTTIEEWAPILTVPGIVFVNLQYDECGDELVLVRDRFGVTVHRHPQLDLFNDLEGAFAHASLLDLAITTGTTAYAFPAATGVETWLLTTAIDYLTQGTSYYPWYARTRCFHRPHGADWRTTMAAVGDALRAKVAAPR